MGGSWTSGWKEYLVGHGGYEWADWKDGKATAELERYLALGRVTRDQMNDALEGVWDDHADGKVKSVPAILLHRLREKYG